MEKISAQTRNAKKSVNNTIRKSGGIPAVLYGHGIPNEHVSVDGKAFTKLYKTTGETDIIGLRIAGEKADRSVLVQDVALDPVRNTIVHVDFHQIRMDEKIKIHIPLAFIGESAAVKSEGGVLVKNIYKVEIEALPHDVPHEITVDIGRLATFADAITLEDLALPPQVKVHGDPKEVIAKVVPPRTESELTALAEEVVLKVDEVKVETEEKRKEREAAKAEEEKAAQ